MRYLSVTTFLFVSALSQADAQFIETTILPITSPDYRPEIPSKHRSMGHISIALRDELADPFINPADLLGGPKDLIFATSGISTWTYQEQIANPYSGNIARGDEYSTGSISADAGIISHNDTTGFAFTAGWHRNRRSVRGLYQSLRQQHEYEYSYNSDYIPLGAAFGGVIPGSGIALGASASWSFITGGERVPFFYPDNTASHPDDGRPGGNRYEVRLGASAPVAGGTTRMIAGYTLMNLGKWIYTEDRHTGFAQFDYLVSLSEHLDIGARTLMNITGQSENSNDIRHRTSTVAVALNIGAGAAWHAPWGTAAAEYIIEPVSSATALQSAEFRPAPDGQLVQYGWYQLADREDDMLNHTLRAGMQIPLSAAATLRLGSQVRMNRYSCNCTDEGEEATLPETMPVHWTELALTGGMEIELGWVRVLADGELMTGRGIPDLPPQSSGPTRQPRCPIPPAVYRSLHEAPMLAGRLTLLWHPEF